MSTRIVEFSSESLDTRLFSLLDLMNKFNAWELSELLVRLQKHKRGIIEPRAAEGGDTGLTNEEVYAFGQMRDTAYQLAKTIEFNEVCERIPILEQRLYADRTLAGLQSVLDQLGQEVLDEMKGRSFLWVPKSYTSYVDNDALFGEQVKAAFPHAAPDIRDAGNCLAAACGTAAVFHLMRAVEWGLRAFCVHFGLRKAKAITKSGKVKLTPIAYAEWDVMLKQAQAKMDARLAKLKRGVEKQRDQEYYPPLLKDIDGFRNAWRVHVMHTRAEYEPKQALDVCSYVERFMRRLSERVKEL